MDQQDKREERAQDPAEGRNDTPPPEKGSPGGDESAVSDEAAEHVEERIDRRGRRPRHDVSGDNLSFEPGAGKVGGKSRQTTIRDSRAMLPRWRYRSPREPSQP